MEIETQEPATADTPKAKTAKRSTSMTLINFWLDAALFVAIVVVVWISAMMKVVFPPPTSAAGWQLWGLSFNQWSDVQFYALCVAALLALEHLVLHWNWVCTVLATRVLRVKNRPDQGIQAVYGVGTLITILVLTMASILVALLCAKPPPGP